MTTARAETGAARRQVRPRSGQSLSRHVAEDLIARIGAGEFAPGDKLPGEIALMTQYGVGRNTVREAVQQLVALQMLDVRPRRGATVLSASAERALPMNALSALLSSEVTEDLYEMRLVLETEAAALAAERATPEQVQELRFQHASYERKMLAGLPAWEEDLAFHNALAQATHNCVLPLMLGAAADLLITDRRANAVLGAVEEAEAFREHTLILEAISAGDRQLARRRMAEHIHTASGYAARVREHEARLRADT